MDRQLIIYICIAGAVAAAVYFLSQLFVTGKDSKLRQRLNEQSNAPAPSPSSAAPGSDPNASYQTAPQPERSGAADMLSRIGQAASQPFAPSREKQSKL